MNVHQAVERRRVLKIYSDLTRKLETAKKHAAMAAVTTHGVSHPLWAEVLRPELEEEVRRFQEVLCWNLVGDAFVEARGSARRAKRLLADVLSTAGQRDKYTAEIQDLTEKIEALEKAAPYLRSGDGRSG